MKSGIRNDSNFRDDLGKEDSDLAMVLVSMPDWADKDISLACFTGGLSNQVYRIDVINQTYVARIPGRVSNLLGGNREAEIHNTVIAGELGVAPRVLKVIEESGGLILEYIEGIPLTAQLLSDDRIINSAIDTLKRLHGGTAFCNTFSMSTLIDQFVAIIAEQGLAKLKDFDSRYSSFNAIKTILELPRTELVPCHNDAFPKNWILDRDRKAILIDFEYSGNNDSAFDLATLYVEAGWNEAQLHEVCRLYYGASSEKRVSRVWLHSILFDVGWALYAVVKSSVATDATRFSKIALSRWERACAKLESLDFERQMNAAMER